MSRVRPTLVVWGSTAVLAIAVLVVAVVANSRGEARSGHAGPLTACPSHFRAAVAARLEGRCGILLGAAVDPDGFAQARRVGSELGRPLDMTYEFHDLDDRFPTADERALVASGRVLHITVDARLYESPATVVTWAQVASGDFDPSLTAQARGIAALHAPVLLTFDHEPDQPRRDASGTPADFAAAWRHVHTLFERAGAHRIIWTWVVTGVSNTATRALAMWPGDAFVDWISWEAYNPSGCRHGAVTPAKYLSFAQTALPFYNLLRSQGAAAGIDVDKPMMISEAASVRYVAHPDRAAKWYLGMSAVLETHPQIRAVGLWDRPGNPGCSYRFDTSPQIRGAVGHVVRTSPFTTR